jgi:hypothetical protein
VLGLLEGQAGSVGRPLHTRLGQHLAAGIGQEIEDTRKVMGDNPWPYGIKANEKALEALFQYSYEQDLAKRRLTIEELFHPSTLDFEERL